jgi:hypothetical protein
MADYQLTQPEEPCAVIRTSDGACIPPDMANTDYNCADPFRLGYVQWVGAGGVPDPYAAPEPVPPAPTPEQQILFDHENRLRTQEGTPPLTLEDFTKKMSGGDG